MKKKYRGYYESRAYTYYLFIFPYCQEMAHVNYDGCYSRVGNMIIAQALSYIIHQGFRATSNNFRKNTNVKNHPSCFFQTNVGALGFVRLPIQSATVACKWYIDTSLTRWVKGRVRADTKTCNHAFGCDCSVPTHTFTHTLQLRPLNQPKCA